MIRYGLKSKKYGTLAEIETESKYVSDYYENAYVETTYYVNEVEKNIYGTLFLTTLHKYAEDTLNRVLPEHSNWTAFSNENCPIRNFDSDAFEVVEVKIEF